MTRPGIELGSPGLLANQNILKFDPLTFYTYSSEFFIDRRPNNNDNLYTVIWFKAVIPNVGAIITGGEW